MSVLCNRGKDGSFFLENIIDMTISLYEQKHRITLLCSILTRKAIMHPQNVKMTLLDEIPPVDRYRSMACK